MRLRSFANRMTGSITSQYQQGSLQAIFDTFKGTSRRSKVAAAIATAMLAPAVFTRSDSQFIQDREYVMADLAREAIARHWHNPDRDFRVSVVSEYRDGVFDIGSDEIVDYAQEHFAELWPIAGLDQQTIIDAYASQSIILAQNPYDLDEILMQIEELRAGISDDVCIDDIIVRVEDLNAQSDDKLHQLAIRATIRNSHALLNGQINREQLRDLLELDGVRDLNTGISTDDVIDYMASHLDELLDHEVFGNHVDEGSIRIAMNTLHEIKSVEKSPLPPGL